MTDAEFDKMLRAALLESARQRWGNAMEKAEPMEWSPNHRRQIDRLLKDPFGMAQRWARPVWKKALNTAASILLILSLGFGGLMAVSPSARAWVQRVFEEWAETYTSFWFAGDAVSDVDGIWKLGYVPEGYVETDLFETAGSYYFTFENEDGDQLFFDSTPVSQGNVIDLDNEHSDYREITLNDQPAYMFIANQEGWPSFFIWFDQTGNTAFSLNAYMEAEELLRMAESIILEK